MVAGNSPFLLTNSQIWITDPFSSLSFQSVILNHWMLRLARPACVTERFPPIILVNIATLSLGELQIEQLFLFFFFFLREIKAFSYTGSKATGSSKNMSVIVFLKYFVFPLILLC